MLTGMYRRRRRGLHVILGITSITLLAALAIAQQHAEDWPEWRGKGRLGVWNDAGLVDKLPATLPVTWRTPINRGYSGPAVAGGHVFVTDAHRARAVGDQVVERLVVLDESTGKILWTKEWETDYSPMVDVWSVGPVATPTVDGDRVYVVGRMGDLLALNVADGEVLWQKNYEKDFGTIIPLYGTTAAPIVDGDRLIALVGGLEGANYMALDKFTGKEIWRSRSSDPEPGYNQPTIIEAAGVRQLIAWDPNALSGLDPVTGKIYWEVPFTVQLALTIATPVHSGPYLFVATQYSGARMVKLDDKKPGATLLWSNDTRNEDTINPATSTPVIDGDYIYGLSAFGTLRCLEVATGKLVWETQALTKEHVQYASAYFVRNGDRYFINNDRGELIIAKLSPKGYEEISRSPLITPTHPQIRRREAGLVAHWTQPAYANKHLITRNDNEIISVNLAKE
jgi:outer membrane protein assembly factor BamB